ncbi:MAG: putative nucleotidyltransferase substrate binding domain-containing protein, partial [Schleiferiaceae bacterium]
SATSPLWRGTPAQWQQRLLSWVRQPDEEALLRLSIVQDARAIAGDTHLAMPAFNAFYTELAQQQNTLSLLAKDALRNPSPLNFFKRFKLEEGGLFDLKLRAILPFIDAAKVLSAAAGKTHLSSTKARLESAKNETNEELITSAQHAYEILLQLRLKFGQKGGDHGRYFDPTQLDQLDRQLLRNVLKTLEALQAHLKLKFKL